MQPGGDTHGLIDLERDECVALLSSVPVGRLVHTAQALPTIRPMNFLLLPHGIHLRTSRDGTVHRAAEARAVVAFEADDYDPDGHYGWSVVVVGRLQVVSDPAALARMADAPLQPWATGPREEVVRLPLELVTGRRVGGPVLRQRVPAG